MKAYPFPLGELRGAPVSPAAIALEVVAKARVAGRAAFMRELNMIVVVM